MNKKQTLEELLAQSEGKNLLFLGKKSLFDADEIRRFLKPFKISLTDNLNSDTVATIEPSKLNPVEEMMSEQAYEMGIPSYDLQELEELISQDIDDDALLMAVKLSNDQSRLKRLLSNPHLSNTLFVRLLKMYEWEDEEEESRDDRDVIMYTLRRYIDIKPNEEDLLYSYLTLRRLATEANDPQLLLALLNFPNFEFLVRGKGRTTLRQTIASNEHLDEELTRKLLALRDKSVERALAGNNAVSADILEKLAERNDLQIDKALATNSRLTDGVFERLLERASTEVLELLLLRQPMDTKRVEMIRSKDLEAPLFALLGANETLDPRVINILFESGDQQLLAHLAANPAVSRKILEKIYAKMDPNLYVSLARNPNTDPLVLEKFYDKGNAPVTMLQALAANPATGEEILRTLFERDDLEINRALATNASLPLDLLNILKIDTRLQNELAQNQRLIDSYEAVLTQKKGMVNV